jgi:N-glycosylase/DNA lyase
MDTSDLIIKYESKKPFLKQRLTDFKKIQSNEEIMKELIFCLLTPGSKAKFCWKATENLFKSRTIFSGNARQIKKHLIGVRFNNGKSKRIADARKMFVIDNRLQIKNILNNGRSPKELREWLVKNVNGYGHKEASHFLRNIGLGEDLAILDRHVLKNLKKYNVIEEIPKSLTEKKYLEIEEKMKSFAEEIGIPFAELDLLLWSEEAGEIFK